MHGAAESSGIEISTVCVVLLLVGEQTSWRRMSMFHMVKKGLQWIVNPKMRMYTHIDQQPFVVLTLFFFCGCHNYIERKSRSTKVRLFTVPCCSIIPVSSKRWGKNLNLLLFVLSFYNSCLCPSFVFPPYFAFTNVVL